MNLLKLYMFLNLGASIYAHHKNGHHFVVYETNDLIFINNFQPFWESSSQNHVINHSSQPPSFEDDKEPPRKVARKWQSNR